MKKNIKSFMQSLEENKDGFLSGGFGSIKGGFAGITRLLSTNQTDTCTNVVKCAGTNTQCTNSTDCITTTNTFLCSNDGTCII